MNRRFLRSILQGLIGPISLWIWTGLAGAQPFFINGNVQTPSGGAIADAAIWFQYVNNPWGGASVVTYSHPWDGRYGAAFMPRQYDIRIWAAKPGYEFTPSEYYFAKYSQPWGDIPNKHFTGIPVRALTSGMKAAGAADPNGLDYFSAQVPAGATQLQLQYVGTGNANLVAQGGTWPTSPAPSPAHLQASTATTKTLMLTPASTPPLSAGKWYIAVQALEDSTYTLSLVMFGPGDPPQISGLAYYLDGATTVPIAGAAVLATNGATTDITDMAGLYSLTVPFYWGGTVSVSLSDRHFAPSARVYGNIEANLSGQAFREIRLTAFDLREYLLGLKSLDADEQAAADCNHDQEIDIADIVRRVNSDGP